VKHEPEEKKMPSKKNEPRQRATELEWLRWFAHVPRRSALDQGPQVRILPAPAS
jgi:hypothetical protein